MGGYSSERLISLQSGGVVYRHLDREKYNLYPIDISRQGWFYINDLEERYPVDKNEFTVTVDGEKIHFDAVFNAIHGPAIKAFGQQYLPFADLGLGWICPTLIGAAIGLILHFMRGNRAKA